jgi:hypothetical protein
MVLVFRFCIIYMSFFTPRKRVFKLYPPSTTVIRWQIGFGRILPFWAGHLSLLPTLDKGKREQNPRADGDGTGGDTLSGLGDFVGMYPGLRSSDSLHPGLSHLGLTAPRQGRFDRAGSRHPKLAIRLFAFISPGAWQRGLDIRRPTLLESYSQFASVKTACWQEVCDQNSEIWVSEM